MAKEKKVDHRTLVDFQFYQIPDFFIKEIMPQADTSNRKLVICIFASNEEKITFYSRLQKTLKKDGLNIYLESWVFHTKNIATMIIDDQMLLLKHPNVKVFKELPETELNSLKDNRDHKVNSNGGTRTLTALMRNILSKPSVIEFIEQSSKLKTKYESELENLQYALLSHRQTAESNTSIVQNNNVLTNTNTASPIQSIAEMPRYIVPEVFQLNQTVTLLDAQIKEQNTVKSVEKRKQTYSGVITNLANKRRNLTNSNSNNNNQAINEIAPIDIKILIKTFHVEKSLQRYYLDTPERISEFKKISRLKKYLPDETAIVNEIYMAKVTVLGADKSLGAFSRMLITKGSILGVYAGKKVARNKSGFYVASYNDDQGKMWHLDGSEEGNWVGRINHSKYPNTKFVKIEDENGFIQIAVEAIADIAPEEQILVDYGDSFVLENEVALNPSDSYFTPSEILSHYKAFYHHELLNGNLDINLQDPFYSQTGCCIVTKLVHYLLTRNLREFKNELEEIQAQPSAYQILHLPVLINTNKHSINLLDAHRQQNTTAFHLAVKMGETAFVELLLKQGVNPNQRQTLTGDSVLHLLAATPAIKSYEEMFSVLQGKVLITMENLQGETALHMAVKLNNTAFIRDFLKAFGFHKDIFKLLFDVKNRDGLDIFGAILVEGRTDMAKAFVNCISNIRGSKSWLIGNFNRYNSSLMRNFISNCPDHDFLQLIHLLDNHGFFEKIFKVVKNAEESIRQSLADRNTMFSIENNNGHGEIQISKEIDLAVAIILRVGEIIRDKSFLELEFDNKAAQYSSGFFQWCITIVADDQELMSESTFTRSL